MLLFSNVPYRGNVKEQSCESWSVLKCQYHPKAHQPHPKQWSSSQHPSFLSFFFSLTHVIWMSFPRYSEKEGHCGRRWIQNYYYSDSSQQMASFVRVCILKSVLLKVVKESTHKKFNEGWPDTESRSHSGGCCQVRMIRPSIGSLHTLVALDSFQFQPPPEKTELTFSSVRRCRI